MCSWVASTLWLMPACPGTAITPFGAGYRALLTGRRPGLLLSHPISKPQGQTLPRLFWPAGARDPASGGDTALAVHPGLINTTLARGWLVGSAIPLLAPLARPWRALGQRLACYGGQRTGALGSQQWPLMPLS
jgi:hypothetical protein